MKSGLPSSTASSRSKNPLRTTNPCQGASETKLKTDKNCEPNEKGPQKNSFNDGKKKRKTKTETISTTAKTTAGGDQTSCTSTIWMHAPAPELRTCEEKQPASKQGRASETLEGRNRAFPKP